MEINMWHLLALCICLGQICSGVDEYDAAAYSLNKKVEIVRDNFYGAGEQFVCDVKAIFEKYQNDSDFALSLLESIVRIERNSKSKHTKLDVDQVKNFNSTEPYPYIRDASVLGIAIQMDELKIIQSIFSKQLPPERYNGLINLLYIFLNKNATTEEIESTLNYLYGIDTAATQTSYLDKFPELSSADCPSKFRIYSIPEAENTLKSMVDIKPKVIQDFMAIRDKFPCNSVVLYGLQFFVDLLKRFHGDESKVDGCKMQKKPTHWEDAWERYRYTRYYIELESQQLETTLSARLTDETYRGILNFVRAAIPDTPIGEIEKALEYLYDDVPKTECPVTESSKLATK